MLLLMFAWQDGECWPGQARVAEAANCSVNTVEKYLKELQDYGLISWKRRGLGWPNVYGGQQVPWLFYRPFGG